VNRRRINRRRAIQRLGLVEPEVVGGPLNFPHVCDVVRSGQTVLTAGRGFLGFTLSAYNRQKVAQG
jgi:hypothetical protein